MRIVARQNSVHFVEAKQQDLPPRYLQIETKYSVISPGTELNMIQKSKDQEWFLGYSASGIVVACGEDVSEEEFQVGDHVACYGAPYVGHASTLTVPTTLCAKVPPEVDLHQASLSGIGAIAIHALRKAELQFGESVVVVGLGLLGQIITQIAHTAAYNVIGYDLNEQRANLLTSTTTIPAVTNREDLEKWITDQTKGHGVDAVLLCVGGQNSPLPEQSLQWVRKQGKVVIVGAIEPDFPRNLMFAKEADIRISRAAGPGRYDTVYEKEVIDYPYGYVRWTEGRNVGEFIRLLNDKRVHVDDLIKEVVHIKQAKDAYQSLLNQQTDVLTKVFSYT